MKNSGQQPNSSGQLTSLLHHLSFVMSRQADQILLERMGLGYSQYKILMALQWQPNVKQKEVASILGQTEASISRQINMLHEQGFLRITRRTQDRRQHLITLTAKGERFLDEAMNILGQHQNPIFNSLSEKDQKSLLNALRQVHSKTCSTDQNDTCRQVYRT